MDDIYKRMHDDTEIEECTEERSRIQDFFDGQTVFLTGCTGFMGKMFVEKLLRSCPGVKRLYLLVRPKKQSSFERMHAYFNNPIFEVLKKERRDYRSVVSIVEGDLLKENLGLSEEDRAALVEETTLVYHYASNIKVIEKMGTAIKVNVFGTKYMLDLAKECKRLVAFLYVSTAYSHCYNRDIREEFYSPPGDMKMMSDIMAAEAAIPEGIGEGACKEIRGKWPNNYAFTKSMAEHLVEQCAKDVTFACAVYRPSMVIPTYLEPIRAWGGNIAGPIGGSVGNAIGFLHAMNRASDPLDLVPGDMATNALFAATWDAATNGKAEKRAIVYNYGSTTVNRISIKKLAIFAARGKMAPSINTIGKHYMIYTDYRWQYWLVHLTVHLPTALVVDFLLICAGRKPRLFAYWKLLTENIELMFFFMSDNWRIHVPRMKGLWDRMSERDSRLFFSDLRKLDWEEYGYAYWMGIRVYLLKEPLDNMMVARKRYEKIKLAHDIFYYLTLAVILYYVGGWFFSIFLAPLL